MRDARAAYCMQRQSAADLFRITQSPQIGQLRQQHQRLNRLDLLEVVKLRGAAQCEHRDEAVHLVVLEATERLRGRDVHASGLMLGKMATRPSVGGALPGPGALPQTLSP